MLRFARPHLRFGSYAVEIIITFCVKFLRFGSSSYVLGNVTFCGSTRVLSRFDQRRRGTHSSCRTQSEICDMQRVVGEIVNWSFTERSSRRVEMITDDILLRRRPNTQFPNSTDGVPLPERFNTFFIDTISRIICRIDARAEPTTTEYQAPRLHGDDTLYQFSDFTVADIKHIILHSTSKGHATRNDIVDDIVDRLVNQRFDPKKLQQSYF